MLSPSLEVSQVQLGKAVGNSELDLRCSEDSSVLDLMSLTLHHS